MLEYGHQKMKSRYGKQFRRITKMEPNEILHEAALDAQLELTETPFLCIQCGQKFDCIDDVEFHVLMEHNFIMCQTKSGKLISYGDLLGYVAVNMTDGIVQEALNDEKI